MRAAENGETLGALLRRRGRPLYISDGHVLTAAEPGSLRTVLVPGWRIAKEGIVVVAAAVSILVGVDHLAGGDAAPSPVEPQSEPYLFEDLPGGVELQITISRDREQVTVTYRRQGWHYVPLLLPTDRGIPPPAGP